MWLSQEAVAAFATMCSGYETGRSACEIGV
jgi:hypothetical protein